MSQHDVGQAAAWDARCLASKQRGLEFNSCLLRYSSILSDSRYTFGETSPMLANVQDRSNMTEIIEEMKVAIIATKLHKNNLI